jgi:hypothetical protein
MYTDEQLNAMTAEQLKIALKESQPNPATIKEKFAAYAENFLKSHGVSLQIAGILSAIAADALYNLASNIVQMLLK